MKASVLDLRYKMKEILKALDRNEKITILYHGKEKGVITPSKEKNVKRIFNHPFFGMGTSKSSVLDEMDDIRKPRY